MVTKASSCLLLIYVLFILQPLHQRFDGRFILLIGTSRGQLHFFYSSIKVALGAGQSLRFVVGQPVVRIFLDVDPIDIEGLVLLALLLKLASVDMDLNGAAQRQRLVADRGSLVFAVKRVQ